MARATRKPPRYTRHEDPRRVPMMLKILPWITCVAAIPFLVIVIRSGWGSTRLTSTNMDTLEGSFPKVTWESLRMLRFDLIFDNTSDWSNHDSGFTTTQWALYLNSGCFVYDSYLDPFEENTLSKEIKHCQRMHSFSVQDLAALSNHTVGDPVYPQVVQSFPQTMIKAATPRALFIASTVLIPLSLTFHALIHISKRLDRPLLSPWVGFPIVIILSGIALVFLCTAAGLLTQSIDNVVSDLLQMQLQLFSHRLDSSSMGIRFMKFIWAPTGLMVVGFLAVVLEYSMLQHEAYRQRKITAYNNSHPAELPGQADDFPPEYQSKSEEVQEEEVGEAGRSEAIALREIDAQVHA